MFKTLLQPLITCFRPRSMEESSSNSNNPTRSGRSEYRASTAVLSAATDAFVARPAPLTSAPRQESDAGGRALAIFANHLLLTTGKADLSLTNALESVNKEMHALVRDSNLKAVMLNAIRYACENMQPVNLPHPNAVLRVFKSEWTPEKFANPTNRSGFQSVLLQLDEAAYNARANGDHAGCEAFERYQKELTINAPAGQRVSDARGSWDPYEKFGRAWCEAEHKIRQDNLFFNDLPEALRKDKDLLILALQQSPHPLLHAGPDCGRDIDIMMHVAKRYPFVWVRQYADVSICNELLQRCAAENIPTR